MTKKPIIGIGADVHHREGKRDRAFVYMTYVEAIRRAGAIPLILPPQPENVAELLRGLDGVLLAGGFDCDPQVYGEAAHPSVEPMDVRRQQNDYALADAAREARVPLLGICLGLQMMNVAAGGSLIQDIATQVETDLQHASDPEDRVRHDVTVRAGTRLASILGARRLNVNSSHHQAVGTVGRGLRVNADAPDGVIEGLEDPDHPFYVGVQWHPEDLMGEESAAALFEAFLLASRNHAAGTRATETSPVEPHAVTAAAE